jgi:hypothetical protein
MTLNQKKKKIKPYTFCIAYVFVREYSRFIHRLSRGKHRSLQLTVLMHPTLFEDCLQTAVIATSWLATAWVSKEGFALFACLAGLACACLACLALLIDIHPALFRAHV